MSQETDPPTGASEQSTVATTLKPGSVPPTTTSFSVDDVAARVLSSQLQSATALSDSSSPARGGPASTDPAPAGPSDPGHRE